MLDRVLRGCCVGNATCDFSERSAILSQELIDLVAPGSGTAADDESLVWNWVDGTTPAPTFCLVIPQCVCNNQPDWDVVVQVVIVTR